MSDAIQRRDFLLATSVLAASSSSADEGSCGEGQDKPPRPSPVSAALALVLTSYPDQRLNEAAIEIVQNDLQQLMARSALLSSFPLQNGDDPCAFSAFRGD